MRSRKCWACESVRTSVPRKATFLRGRCPPWPGPGPTTGTADPGAVKVWTSPYLSVYPIPVAPAAVTVGPFSSRLNRLPQRLAAPGHHVTNATPFQGLAETRLRPLRDHRSQTQHQPREAALRLTVLQRLELPEARLQHLRRPGQALAIAGLRRFAPDEVDQFLTQLRRHLPAGPACACGQREPDARIQPLGAGRSPTPRR